MEGGVATPFLIVGVTATVDVVSGVFELPFLLHIGECIGRLGSDVDAVVWLVCD